MKGERLMKIIHIAGSPRIHGNSTRIAATFCRAAEKKGADTSTYFLNTMHVKGCQGCMACKNEGDRCVVKDDLSPVLEEIYSTDVLVLSTPVYLGDVSGQLKCCLDRMFSFATPDLSASRLPKGKKLVFIQTQGADESAHGEVAERYLTIFNRLSIGDTYLIRACNVGGEGDVEKQPQVLARAEELADMMTG
jgi:multimeric flavodoxin WrbA